MVQGLVTKAIGPLIDWATEERGITCIERRAVPSNAPGIRVPTRLGMTHNGTTQEATPGRSSRDELGVWSIDATERGEVERSRAQPR